ncbi:GNAT family N-acetyltransferase [Alkalihalobacillus pseudalcaliphilus]|uniref:GNAT family N-acetyltransferase n=1 Tax=Alkalihalobacillus pseudalcaliphilus TaxID=79884 RepID=UPI00064DA98A|nr:N-acetyltransferase [Alkalihalobacillus pseudalcaliphilus]KMK74348.1 GCN5 family acetyltransferase [Alkalihalobacillus pseudalcaliphilus]
MTIDIRQEKSTDYQETLAVVQQAFLNEEYSNKSEHLLVSKLRKSAAFIPELSLIAFDETTIVGHILLTKITIEYDGKKVNSLALAPVSVLPAYQKKGIGSHLIRTALEKAKELHYDSVIVLGHPQYYPKFGFQKASKWGIQAPFDVTDDSFMALELAKDSLENVRGTVVYPKAFFE